MNITNRILTGDALQVLRTLPDNHVQTVVTSPPYYSLRDYQVDGQIGLESSPDEFIAKLVEVFREARRVLHPSGIAWINIGDSFSAGKAGRTDYGTGDPTSTLGPQRNGLPTNTRPGTVISRKVEGLGPKQLLGIPWRLAFALQDDGWILRQDIIWSKPNAMPESVQDRPTKSHEYLFLLSKSERYYYDASAIAEPSSTEPHSHGRSKLASQFFTIRSSASDAAFREPDRKWGTSGTRNKRSVWTVSTQPYSEAHFATMPPKLIEPCILAGSRPGDIVLDPFCGAGTVPLVAIKHSRPYLGIELNPEYVTLAEKRIATVQQDLWSVACENEVAV